ncbi:MAG TPA: hypothetical protein VFG76_04395 [Candidatus Polarisedimenticolia bacterium]|nr:hypothetical protein [Candidatus Polarisedimenticolia bacterium]
MATVLLADDDRLFKAVQGTLLLRDGCRLLKAPIADLPRAAADGRPDLILISVTDAASKRSLARLQASPALALIPILALDFSARAARPKRAASPSGRAGASEQTAARETVSTSRSRSFGARLIT